ncbi:hypothetical protein [Antarctobacter heliothermus]|uniref:hypothetical protein n=1 Tax=Antarctobacter heliothermus TaxID=74033 RepID=UPI0012FE4047|nr:hypothetical protein [Antarctobacter heliothermus]|tara:strand:- start:237 stop:512 length:276 start_codon:yes stop_codon:yes gene_type:complete
MKIKINDFDCLSEDRDGKTLFVFLTDGMIAFPHKASIKAHVFVSKVGKSFPCKVYHPRPNGFLDHPHLHMKANQELGLRSMIAIGDTITVE